jgi:ABC-type phosphate transport system substrate-binding protein
MIQHGDHVHPKRARLRTRSRRATRLSAAGVAAAVVGVAVAVIGPSAPAGAAVTLNGTGSSFAAPAIESWVAAVSHAPYTLSLNYSSSSSGQGRYEFTNQTTDFAVSDTGYVSGAIGTTPPGFPFAFLPVTAAGVALMYNVPGLTKTLQLTSYTACAILTGGITNWSDSHIAQDNPGQSLPNLTIKPVTESDTAGTNYVLQEWCIAEQPNLWNAFASAQQAQPGGPCDGVPISPNSPTSNWPCILPNGLDDSNTTAVAGDVSANSGAIGAVQLQYAVDDGFSGSNPSKAVASVKNATGAFTQPTPINVASALAYATQLADGTHKLNFNGVGPNVYNPSTYSYLLTPTTGWNPAKGAVLSQFVNYVLTLGQQGAPRIGYATLGLSLERYGVDKVAKDVPGAVAPTPAESNAYSCGDLTPADVAAGKTTPTCGVTNATATSPASNTPGTTGTTAGKGATSANGRTATGSGSSTGGAGGVATSAGGAGSAPGSATAGVTLPSGPLATTGANPLPMLAAGAVLTLAGWFGRRRLMRAPAVDRSP